MPGAAAIWLALGLVFAGFPAMAEPLDKTACTELKAEHKKQLTPEMEQALAQGPDWVKDHLTDAEINKVRDYLDVESKLEFQCRTGRYIKDYITYIPMPDRRPGPPPSDQRLAQHAYQQVVSTSQARAD